MQAHPTHRRVIRVGPVRSLNVLLGTARGGAAVRSGTSPGEKVVTSRGREGDSESRHAILSDVDTPEHQSGNCSSQISRPVFSTLSVNEQ